MPALSVPLSHNPPFTLLALALLSNVEITWTESGDQGEAKYGDITGTEKVREALEQGLPGKEVCPTTGTQSRKNGY